MTLRTISLALLFPLANAALAEDIADLPLSECNVERSWTIDSPALGERAELVATVSVEPEEDVLYNTDAIFFRTRAELELNLSDGRTLDLGSGGKYYDDIDWDTPPSCEELVNKVTVPTRATLMGQALEDEMGMFEPEFRTLNSMHSWAMGGQDCMDSVNLLPGDTPSAACREMHEHYQRFVLEPDPQRDMDGETFRRLVDAKAPIIVIRRSTYYGESFAWDAEARELRYVMAGGC